MVPNEIKRFEIDNLHIFIYNIFVRKILIIAFIFISSYVMGADDSSYVVESVTVISNKRTVDTVILREMELTSGLSLTLSELSNLMDSDTKRVDELGFFKTVEIDYRLNESNWSVDVAVIAVDRWTLFPLPLYAYNNRMGHAGGFLIADFNLFGTGTGFVIFGLIAGDGKYAGVTWSDPRLFGLKWSLKITAGYRQSVEDYYRDGVEVYYNVKEGFYGGVSIGREFGEGMRRILPYLTFDYESVHHLTTLNLLGLASPPDQSLTVGLGIEQGKQEQQNGLSSGMVNKLWVKYNTGSDDWNVELDHRLYLMVGQSATFAYRIVGFYADGNGDFYNSIDSLRGIYTGEISGNYGVFANIELRKRLGSAHLLMDLDFYLPFYVDIGYAWYEWETWNPQRVVRIVGSGLRIYTDTIGKSSMCLRVDLGWNFTPLNPDLGWWERFFLGIGIEEMF